MNPKEVFEELNELFQKGFLSPANNMEEARNNYRIAEDCLRVKKGLSSTKSCPICGNTNLVLLTSSRQKVCNNHSNSLYYIDWNLDKGQNPIYTNNRITTKRN